MFVIINTNYIIGFFNKAIMSYQNIFHLGMATGLCFTLHIYICMFVSMYVYMSIYIKAHSILSHQDAGSSF